MFVHILLDPSFTGGFSCLWVRFAKATLSMVNFRLQVWTRTAYK